MRRELRIKNGFIFLVLTTVLAFVNPSNICANENEFSFSLHAPYNSQGNLSFSGLLDSNFLNYIDTQIENLGKIKVIRNTGKTGLNATVDHITSTDVCPADQYLCRTVSFLDEPKRGWESVDEPIRHATKLNIDIVLEPETPRNVPVPDPQNPDETTNVKYVRNLETIETLKKLVIKALKRYDGDLDLDDDGTDDIKEPIGTVKYWQFPSEPNDIAWKEKININGKSTPLLAIMITEVGSIIKQDCPTCKIILPAVGGDPGWEEFYKDIFDYLDQSEHKDIFDAFDFHHHHVHHYNFEKSNYQYIANRYQEFKNLLNEYGYTNTPIWITELSSWTGSPTLDGKGIYSFHSEVDQANELIKRYIYPFSLGIKKVFWSPAIIDYPSKGGYGGRPNDYFANIGLICRNGFKKISFCSLKLMAQKLDGSTYAKRINMNDGDLFLIRFSHFANQPDRPPVYVLWKENGSTYVDLSNNIDFSEETVITKFNNMITHEDLNKIAIAENIKFIESKAHSISISCPELALGNLTRDEKGLIEETDLNLLLKNWSPSPSSVDYSSVPICQTSADINKDKKIDQADIDIIIKNWKTSVE